MIGTLADIASVCHAATRALAETFGDFTHKPWNEAESWVRTSAMAGVEFLRDNPNLSPEDQHKMWCEFRLREGWRWGPVKSVKDKTHPSLVPFETLPIEERAKDVVFQLVARSMLWPEV